jgi:spore germination cell wall hydrolase CwlJ-like protein
MKQTYTGRLFARLFKLIIALALLFSILTSATTAIAETAISKHPDSANRRGLTTDEKHCLATAIYFEARGEPERGQAAVAQVVLNRVKTEYYPDTICGVVYQNKHKRNACQFSFACDGHPDIARNKQAWKKAQKIAGEIINGRNLVHEVRSATHYHANHIKPYWAFRLKRLLSVGNHIFYRG